AHGLAKNRDWKVVIMTPGAHPLEGLAVRIATERGVSPGAVLDDLRNEPHNFCLAVRQLLLDHSPEARVVLIVDQAEEIFTLCRDESERRCFIELLAHAAAEDAQTVVILSLRADFYGHCAAFPSLAALVQDHQALVGPMREGEIRRAIELPAAKAGLTLEPGGDEQAAVEEVLDILARARLVTVGLDAVEVAHEALIREWPLLRRWLDEDREGLQIHRRLTDDSNEWLRFERDPSQLYRGARLHAALEWADERHGALSPTEREFLDASRAAEETELERSKRRQRRLLGLAIVLAVLLALAVVTAVFAATQRSKAKREERSATARALVQAV